MKKIYFLLGICLCLSQSMRAAVLTVSNNPDIPAEYQDIQAAIGVANPGDTLYINGSNNSYGQITINKKLTLIGAGYRPDNESRLSSDLHIVYLDTIPNSTGASGTKIIGFNIFSVAIVNDSYGYMNIELNRNYISSGINMSAGSAGWIISNNVILGSIQVKNALNTVISNNIIPARIQSSNQSLLVNNNVFTGVGSSFNSTSNALITNNIFYGKNAQGCSQCIINNNVSFGHSNNNDLIYGTNTGAGNLENQDPQFAQVTLRGTEYLEYDYHLNENSPAINSGTDGTDIGVYGGFNSFPEKLTGEPPIPQIESFNILNPVLGIGSQLKFKSTATNKP